MRRRPEVVTRCAYQAMSPATAKIDSRIPLRMAAATQGIFRSGRLEKRRQRRGSRDRGIPGMIFHIGDASRTGGESQGKRPGSLCLVCYFRRTGGSRCSEIVSNQ